MDCQVIHDGTDISNKTISYERSHKICTGVGQISLIVSRTTNETFNPWDSIDIHENGGFQCRYYVSSVSDESPQGTITINGQDNSKRLVDYFIPDTYTIEEPSYSRYWIEKFLDEAGVSYHFDTTSQGNLLSNFTNLGLTQAYDQIITLLQMSGWYMYFDGDGVANIGKLNKELSPVTASYSKQEVLSVSMKKEDKMLRNRALVLGNYDPVLAEQIVAEVSVRTKWNYDDIDKRTVVISNSNIPNNSSALAMANQIIKEFSTITVEKYITIAGAKNLQVGDIVGIKSNVFQGKGLVTTFGTSMSAQGLVTNLVLDERCPRLFGFFNFGDYVYVGTYGDGIWRKHLRFDPTWYDFSDGLDELRITDLHIDRGIFSSVGASGQMYYNLADDTAWSKVQLDSLYSYEEDEPETLFSGVTMSGYTPFSGIMARATMVDKTLNRFIYGVDTYSGENLGDYYLTLSGFYDTLYSGYTLQASGVLESGWDSNRGWILEYNIASGFDTYNSYPISYSGNFNIMVLDIENDGSHDYVSVKSAKMEMVLSDNGKYNFGKNTAYARGLDEFSRIHQDIHNIVSIGEESSDIPINSRALEISSSVDRNLFTFDNETVDSIEGVIETPQRDVLYQSGTSVVWIHVYHGVTNLTNFSRTSPAFIVSGETVRHINRMSNGYFKILYSKIETPETGEIARTLYKTIIWNTVDNVMENVVELTRSIIPQNPNKVGTGQFGGNTENAVSESICTGDVFYIYTFVRAHSSVVYEPDTENYVDFYKTAIDLNWYTAESKKLGRINFQEAGIFGEQGRWIIKGDLPPSSFISVHQGNIAIYYTILETNPGGLGIGLYETTNYYLIYSLDGGLTLTKKLIDTQVNLYYVGNPGLSSQHATQLTGERFFMYTVRSDGKVITFDGKNVLFYESDVPYTWIFENITTLVGNYDYLYIARDADGNYWFCNVDSREPVNQVIFPEKYSLIVPISTTNSTSMLFFWLAYDSELDENVILKTSLQTVIGFMRLQNDIVIDQAINYLAGNFLVSNNPGTYIHYIDNAELVPIYGTGFMVLQREGNDFNLVQRAGYPIRIDISNYSPLLTVQNTEGTFNSFFITQDGGVTQISSHSSISGFILDDGAVSVTGILLDPVNDYRYSLLEGSGIMGSGTIGGLQRMGIYVNDNNIKSMDIQTMSGWTVLYGDATAGGIVSSGGSAVSGIFNCIESTNYAASGQYMFVTTSGDYPQFYQKDAETDLFVLYSGLPMSRATIIRIDDML